MNNILWIDDEIELLKPQMLFLEKSGYNIEGINSASNSLKLIQDKNFDLIFIDYNMPGIDGLTLFKRIREINHIVPIIMVTKSQDLEVINRAISSGISDFLVKPINPYQVLSSCKKYLDSSKIGKEMIVQEYLNDFNNIENEIDIYGYDEWIKLYYKIINWDKKFFENRDNELYSMHERKKIFLEERFAKFIKENYKSMVNEEEIDPPTNSVDIVSNYVVPLLDKGEKVFFLVLDCLRLDQWLLMADELQKNFSIKIDNFYSILPTSTPFSRNAIFSGLYPNEIFRRHPEIWEYENEENMGMNTFEYELFKQQLKRYDLYETKHAFLKIYSDDAYNNFKNLITKNRDKDLIAAVVTFIDKLSHEIKSKSILMELVNDEFGFINLTKTWFENSLLKSVLEYVGDLGYTIVVATDHGAVWGKRPLKISGGRDVSKSLRYKHGSVLYSDEKKSMIIDNAHEYKLPEHGSDTKYALCTNDYYFVYPSKYNTYKNVYKNSIFHGGISMPEMILPVSILEKR